jgi:serine O-acetyltransferase
MDKTERTIIKIIEPLQVIRALIHLFLFGTCSGKNIIETDIERWLEITKDEVPKSRWRQLVHLLWKHPEFRNLFYYRIKKSDRGILRRLILETAKLTFRPLETLRINTPSIGPGLFIQHGTCTGIAARSIGKNCWINQNVNIGYSNDVDCPTIGDNVSIKTGAKVFGDIHIGDNSIIGTNAVVLKNVPENCTVIGIPAYIVRRDGKKTREPLE